MRKEADSPETEQTAQNPGQEEKLLKKTLAAIRPVGEEFRRRCKKRWDSLCKPIGGFGDLEDMVSQVGAIEETEDPHIDKTAIVIMAADNGVVAEGVSQCGSEVTAQVLRNMTEGKSSVCIMSKFRPADVFPVDIGMNEPAWPAALLLEESGRASQETEPPGEFQETDSLIKNRVLDRAFRRGTGNIRKEPAMTRDQAAGAVLEGIRIAGSLKEQGYQLLIPGEMGIGNTTTSAACVCAFFGSDPSDIAGRGAGLTDQGVRRKAEVIREAILTNRPDPDDPLDVLSKVGGLDIAGMTGLFLGAAETGMPVLIDGFIAALAAYAAERLAPEAKGYMIPSIISSEPGDRILLESMGMKAGISFGMHLGEGTGAAGLLPLLDEAFFVYRNLPVFGESGIKAYKSLA